IFYTIFRVLARLANLLSKRIVCEEIFLMLLAFLCDAVLNGAGIDLGSIRNDFDPSSHSIGIPAIHTGKFLAPIQFPQLMAIDNAVVSESGFWHGIDGKIDLLIEPQITVNKNHSGKSGPNGNGGDDLQQQSTGFQCSFCDDEVIVEHRGSIPRETE
ncbi:MAG TPA: hypothetical protein VJK52_01420, partial [Candidatus Nanoarchaeia archaeon]|nr:hypothetical protein [Candidatus Nanoarchaeia archaeon]